MEKSIQAIWNNLKLEKRAVVASGNDVPAILVGRVQAYTIALEALGYSDKGSLWQSVATLDYPYTIEQANLIDQESREREDALARHRKADFERRSKASKKGWNTKKEVA